MSVPHVYKLSLCCMDNFFFRVWYRKCVYVICREIIHMQYRPLWDLVVHEDNTSLIRIRNVTYIHIYVLSKKCTEINIKYAYIKSEQWLPILWFFLNINFINGLFCDESSLNHTRTSFGTPTSSATISFWVLLSKIMKFNLPSFWAFW